MGLYVTSAEVQAEGATATAARINARIAKWEALVDRITRNKFSVLEPGELIFDGNNSRILHFNLPLIEVTSVTVNEETTALTADEYRAYTGISAPQDHRHNPKIELRPVNRDSIYRKPRTIFVKGLDQKITAKWGFVDADPDNPGQYVTPQAVKDSVIQLVLLDLDGYFYQQQVGGAVPISPLKREKTDDHEVEYMETISSKTVISAIPRDIYDVLMLYRGPWNIAAPDPRYYTSVIDANRIVAF
jgi:hypothetical protein